MDAYEATKVIFARLQALEPNLAPNIISVLLTKDNNEADMIRLAYGPDNVLHSIIAKARTKFTNETSSQVASSNFPSDRVDEASFAVDKVGCDRGEEFFLKEYDWRLLVDGNHHPSFSLSPIDTPGWKTCLYFKQGFCKNGSTCRFLHGLSNGDRVVAKREMVLVQAQATEAQPQQMVSTFSFSPSPNELNLQLQQHQSGSQREMIMHLGSEDMQNYSPQSSQIDQSDLINNRSACQIYLTFSPNSIFSTEDVCSYFSMYGMVQDVRIPYQEKRMFGFVTFVCQKTVKLILARGNPHYICDAHVLVKPYKEKDKVPTKFSKSPQSHQSGFASRTVPNRLLYSRGPFDLLQRHIGPRILYRDMTSLEAFLRMKQDEQQHATELQHHCLMRLQLLDIQNRGHRSSSPMGSHVPPVHLEDATIQGNKLKNGSAMREIARAAISTEVKCTVNFREEGKSEFDPKTATPNDACGFLESGMEHNLPHSPFSSPTKASIIAATAHTTNISSSCSHMVASCLFFPNIHP